MQVLPLLGLKSINKRLSKTFEVTWNILELILKSQY